MHRIYDATEMKIAVIGTGYVGLVTGTCFAETGNQVTCVDIDPEKIKALKNGVIPIYEPGLEVLYERNVRQGRLHFTKDLKEGIEGAKIIFLALPTPPDEDGSADMKYVLEVSEELGKIIEDYVVIVDKSTVPVGTSERVKEQVAKHATVEFDIVANPEFLREGAAVDDFMKPERVIIGASSERAMDMMKKIYGPLVRQGNPIIFMDERSAELTKYAANSFLATKISFMNEIASLCEILGTNVDMVRKGLGTDSRIGKRFLFSGIGYGGSCFPKDVLALSHMSKEVDYDFKILNSVMEVNEEQRVKLIPKMKEYFGELNGLTIGVWGLAFKPYTDDIREAPALYNIEALLAMGAKVNVYDPEAMKNGQKHFGDKVTFASNEYEAIQGADALFISTEWPVFRTPDYERMEEAMKNKVIFDGRNLYSIEEMKERGFDYFSIGRPS